MTTKDEQVGGRRAAANATKRAGENRGRVSQRAAEAAAAETRIEQLKAEATARVATIEEAAERYASGDAGRAAILNQATAEQAARRAALASGEPVATPALDFLNASPDRRTARKAAGPRAAKAAAVVRLYRDGKPMTDHHNKLSSLAFDVKMKADDLRAYLAGQGVAEPLATTWKFTLPSGRVIEARPLSDGVQVPAAKTPAKRTTKRAAKKTTAAA